RLSGSAFFCSYTSVQKTPAPPFVPLGRICSSHPRLRMWLCGRPGRRGWPGRARPRGSRVASSDASASHRLGDEVARERLPWRSTTAETMDGAVVDIILSLLIDFIEKLWYRWL